MNTIANDDNLTAEQRSLARDLVYAGLAAVPQVLALTTDADSQTNIIIVAELALRPAMRAAGMTGREAVQALYDVRVAAGHTSPRDIGQPIEKAGVCADCSAVMRSWIDPDGKYRATVIHDPTCPSVKAMAPPGESS